MTRVHQQVNGRRIAARGAEHGYSLPDRDVHDKKATARDWEQIFAMLHRQLPPCVT